MLHFARTCVGKPFSGTAMARSVIWPRKTDNRNFFCAELVAAVLKVGGLLDPVSNPGAATPESLHELYKGRATTTANPYVLRQANCQRQLTTNSIVQQKFYTPPQLQSDTRNSASCTYRDVPKPIQATAQYTSFEFSTPSSQKSALKVLNAGTNHDRSAVPRHLGLTLNSLDFRR
jgi:hypothetical protein